MPRSSVVRPSLASLALIAIAPMLAIASLAPSGCDRGSGSESEAKPAAEAKGEAKTEATTETKTETKAEAKGAPEDAKVQPVAVKTGPDGATPMVDPQAATPPATPLVPEPPPSARTQDETNTISVFEAAAPATVFVKQTAIVQDRAMRAQEVEAGAGTGFIWNADGYIVTNCHVALADCPSLRPAPRLSVTLYDQKVYDAKLVGADPFKDIAVLKIETSDKLVPIRRVPEGHALVVGQKTIAIGNPFGLDHTLTTGVISAMGREVKGIGGVTISEMVQTDAAINPGNSGGPLLDSRGQLIGMNTMIFSASGSSAGIGFAVPHTVIERVVPQIITNGRPTRVGLGISILDEAIARRLGVQGVVVDRVAATSPAGKAGLRAITQTPTGWQVDVIVGVDGERVKIYDDLYKVVESKAPGERVKLSVLRLPGEELLTIETELVEL
ncbi:S1C family serine protease [Paraliomyxa miuraensis]|uniref:S1C family serine protease n=1 Tax=Paraliomyxa miuraensis TaxID=376150 RepID=UPI002254D5E7|nr:trypsin-like peptidase domain-containing protein [Paraliomyxa miuraensis]MCX4241716.1 trypsin-like peptidase domain-containing protein [Paraliomyxa miuraensis]